MKYDNFLQVWRKRAKLSQWELAQQLGIAQVDVSNIETGKVLPSLDVRQKICGIVGKKLNEVFP